MSNKKEKAESAANQSAALNQSNQAVQAIQLPPAVQALMDRAGAREAQIANKDYSSLPMVQALMTQADRNRSMKRQPMGESALGANGVNANYQAQLDSQTRRYEDEALGENTVNAIGQTQADDTNTILGVGNQNLGYESARAGASQGVLNDTTNQYQFARRESFLAKAALATISGLAGGAGGGLGQVIGKTSSGGCWVAAELFGGWDEPKTMAAREYVTQQSPRWFYDLYMKHGEAFARRLKGRKLLRWFIRPLFEYFAWRGRQ